VTRLLALLLAAGVARQHLGPPLPAQMRRIVTLAPSLSEIVLALGAGDRLVAAGTTIPSQKRCWACTRT
jgi:ABC-type hemin transport system substrate-binding protein